MRSEPIPVSEALLKRHSEVQESDLRASLAHLQNDLQNATGSLQHIGERLAVIASHYERLLSDQRQTNEQRNLRNELEKELQNLLAKFGLTAKEV